MRERRNAVPQLQTRPESAISSVSKIQHACFPVFAMPIGRALQQHAGRGLLTSYVHSFAVKHLKHSMRRRPDVSLGGHLYVACPYESPCHGHDVGRCPCPCRLCLGRCPCPCAIILTSQTHTCKRHERQCDQVGVSIRSRTPAARDCRCSCQDINMHTHVGL